MPKDQPVKVEPKPLPPSPSWEDLKANAQFREWHASPFLQMMTAALRKSYPVSLATDPHVIINQAGVLNGWLKSLEMTDSFCQLEGENPDRETPKHVPYQHQNHENQE